MNSEGDRPLSAVYEVEGVVEAAYLEQNLPEEVRCLAEEFSWWGVLHPTRFRSSPSLIRR